MNCAALIERVVRIVQDTDFDEDYIKDALNRAMLKIAGGILRPGSSILTQPLPELYTIGSSLTSTTSNKIPLPSDYQRGVIMACNSIGAEIQIYNSFQEFVQTYPLLNYTGQVSAIGIKGRDIYLAGIPATRETITFHYHRYPVDMTADADVPDGLPAEFHDSLLVNYVCRDIFRLKEDGIDGNDFNVQRYDKLFQEGLIELDASMPADGAMFR